MTPGTGVTDPRTAFRGFMAALLIVIGLGLYALGLDEIWHDALLGLWMAGVGFGESLYDSRKKAGT